MKYKISIIIPVYNIEKYLKKCLNSVINQTLREIEIICVNDGSKDNSLQILEDYAKQDERLKVITKKNGGIGSARNEGLKHVTGEYIGFVDSDDWIELDMYEKLYEEARSNDCDMVMCSAHIFDDIGQKFKFDQPYFKLACFDEVFDDIVFDHTQTISFMFEINVTPWNKIYKSKLIKDNNITFQKSDFEDNPFFYECYLKSKRVSLIREDLYFYRINRKGSFLNTGNLRFFDIVPTFELIGKIIKENNPEYLEAFFNAKVSSTSFRYDQVDEGYKPEFFEIMKSDFYKIDPNHVEMLNKNNLTIYENVMEARDCKEYQLYVEIRQLNQLMAEKLHKQGLEYYYLFEKQKLEIKNRDKLIEEIKNSNSWKLTKPLRKTVHIVKNLKFHS